MGFHVGVLLLSICNSKVLLNGWDAKSQVLLTLFNHVKNKNPKKYIRLIMSETVEATGVLRASVHVECAVNWTDKLHILVSSRMRKCSTSDWYWYKSDLKICCILVILFTCGLHYIRAERYQKENNSTHLGILSDKKWLIYTHRPSVLRVTDCCVSCLEWAWFVQVYKVVGFYDWVLHLCWSYWDVAGSLGGTCSLLFWLVLRLLFMVQPVCSMYITCHIRAGCSTVFRFPCECY